MTQLVKFYKGFSTKRYADGSSKSFDLYNVDLIEEDLFNEIFTVQGERLEMPEFGTRIPTLTFEVNDDETAEVVREDLERVFAGDPRVRLINLDLLQQADAHALIAIAKLEYLEFNVVKDLRIEFGSR